MTAPTSRLRRRMPDSRTRRRFALPHQARATAAQNEPAIDATHPTDGDLSGHVVAFGAARMFPLQHHPRTCATQDVCAAGEPGDGPHAAPESYMLTDSPENQARQPVQATDLAALWAEHGLVGLLLLAGMDEWDLWDGQGAFTSTPLADRLAAVRTALAG